MPVFLWLLWFGGMQWYAVTYYDWIVNKNDGRLQMEFCNPYQGENRRCVDNDRCNYVGAHIIGLLKNY